MNPNATLEQLQNLSTDAPYYKTDLSSTIRDRAVKEAAESLGMQAGLQYESDQIDQVLKEHETQLDRIFNFSVLLYQNNVLPPVIVKASNTVHINEDGDFMRIAGQTYRIIQQVRFVTASPTWRDYLWMDYPKPEMPDRSVLPKNDEEKEMWQLGVANGWNAGINQAMTIYHINLNRLVRDFDGMVLYKTLLLKNMVSPFYVSKKYYGVTGDKNQMAIDDQSWDISTKPQLQLHSSLWQPVIRVNNNDQ